MYSAVFALSLLACAGGQALGMKVKEEPLTALSWNKESKAVIEGNRIRFFTKAEGSGNYLRMDSNTDVFLPEKDSSENKLDIPISLAVNSSRVAVGYQLKSDKGVVVEYVSGGRAKLPKFTYTDDVPSIISYSSNAANETLYIVASIKPIAVVLGEKLDKEDPVIKPVKKIVNEEKKGGLGGGPKGGKAAQNIVWLWITNNKPIVGFSAVVLVATGIGTYLWNKQKSKKSKDDSFEQEAESVVQ